MNLYLSFKVKSEKVDYDRHQMMLRALLSFGQVSYKDRYSQLIPAIYKVVNIYKILCHYVIWIKIKINLIDVVK